QDNGARDGLRGPAATVRRRDASLRRILQREIEHGDVRHPWGRGGPARPVVRRPEDSPVRPDVELVAPRETDDGIHRDVDEIRADVLPADAAVHGPEDMPGAKPRDREVRALWIGGRDGDVCDPTIR